MPKSRNRPKHKEALKRRQREQALAQGLRQAATDIMTIRREGSRIRMILLAVLAQRGDVTVTDGTLKQVGESLATLDYAIVDGNAKGESIVKLIEVKPEPATVPPPALTITKIEDEDPQSCDCLEDDCLTCNPATE